MDRHTHTCTYTHKQPTVTLFRKHAVKRICTQMQTEFLIEVRWFMCTPTAGANAEHWPLHGISWGRSGREHRVCKDMVSPWVDRQTLCRPWPAVSLDLDWRKLRRHDQQWCRRRNRALYRWRLSHFLLVGKTGQWLGDNSWTALWEFLQNDWYGAPVTLMQRGRGPACGPYRAPCANTHQRPLGGAGLMPCSLMLIAQLNPIQKPSLRPCRMYQVKSLSGWDQLNWHRANGLQRPGIQENHGLLYRGCSNSHPVRIGVGKHF